MNNYFVTGTDTGVGKTHVTALLLAEFRRRGLRAVAMKPIACGCDGRRDAERFAAIINHEQPLNLLNPIYLKHPLAPLVAARLDRRKIRLSVVRTAYLQLSALYELVLVEGAGGLLVPIRRNYFVADLARDLSLPLIIIARLGLGTINHTLLTVRQAEAMRLKVAGIILNDVAGGRKGLAEKTNVAFLPRLCGVPLLGVVPHGHGLSAARRIAERLLAEQRPANAVAAVRGNSC
ncbi:MAG: dethiobiotin synthase [Verrucomicrobiae bacterium]|nr:dethiobiotin synthase [Verrucomicrobiae bacterium]